MAPSKAAARFGQDVHMVTVSGTGVGAGRTKAEEAERWSDEGWSEREEC